LLPCIVLRSFTLSHFYPLPRSYVYICSTFITAGYTAISCCVFATCILPSYLFAYVFVRHHRSSTVTHFYVTVDTCLFRYSVPVDDKHAIPPSIYLHTFRLPFVVWITYSPLRYRSLIGYHLVLVLPPCRPFYTPHYHLHLLISIVRSFLFLYILPTILHVLFLHSDLCSFPGPPFSVLRYHLLLCSLHVTFPYYTFVVHSLPFYHYYICCSITFTTTPTTTTTISLPLSQYLFYHSFICFYHS